MSDEADSDFDADEEDEIRSDLEDDEPKKRKKGTDTKAYKVICTGFTKNLKSDRNRKPISGAKKRFTKIIILWLWVFSNII